jgi:hypothetical protein
VSSCPVRNTFGMIVNMPCTWYSWSILCFTSTCWHVKKGDDGEAISDTA